MSAAGNWPPSVREWVSKCLGMMNDSNRDAASAELKKMIAEAYANNTLWETDWASIELESLKPQIKPFLKRKAGGADDNVSKKSKNGLATSQPICSPAKLQEREKRFRREPEVDSQKNSGSYKPPSSSEYSRHVNAPDSRRKRTDATSNNPGGASGYRTRRQALLGSPLGDDDDVGPDSNVIDWDKYTIVGRSTELFKPYLRITSEPDPAQIRPLEVLERTLAELSRRWRQKPDYVWTCDQLKSMRQDLTVQRIKNKFTVQVYEIHARMALESEDLKEFKYCESRLRELYELGLPGCRDEFYAYRILYSTCARTKTDLNMFIASLTPQQKQQVFIKQALDVHTAISTDNYHKFFVLYLNAHNMGSYILDHIVEAERVKALSIMTKAYQQLPSPFIASELAFESARDAVNFLHECDAAVFINTKLPNDVAAGPGPLGGRIGVPPSFADVSDEAKLLDCRQVHANLKALLETKFIQLRIRDAV
ncbi:SAC3/GANP/Nin1/mts3/eIF-3 p25 family-domain-containing protein [Cantharellus anzutake]|uniref:SAC3/GANP/Nin1/mts3/eIF-3 p25 family-domain-containing protein n=1 Tax=Cantharellus anzutake TaxID=1750568 RepID=UPI00190679DB|nr:SAC3/GANP/Nin1/mts3/eIF-3 p25 family-domain-containing protein [Cantharellus anzutake]KAF8324245.1 SAC3/GANP/Nin1/mts3/eIF-3 p25 family-domain-containing protein [Cantharellus anzutake]